MIINREEMLGALQLVKPALSTKNNIEELKHVWFNGTQLIASNDTALVIVVPFKSEIKGGILGSVLLSLLSNSKAKEIEFHKESNDEAVTWVVKAGRTRLSMPVLPIKRMIAEVQDSSKKSFKASKELLGAFGRVMLGTGNVKSDMAEQAGITIIRTGVTFHVFATDAATISWCRAPVPDECNLKDIDRVILPIEFVEQVLVASKGAKTQIHFGKDSAWATSERMTTYCRLLSTDDPQDLVGTADAIVKNMKFTPIPERLKLALARADAVLLNKDELIDFKVQNKVLRIQTVTAVGDLKDTMQLKRDVPEISTKLNPKLIRRGLGYCDEIAFGKTCSVMAHTESHFYYLISSNP